MKILITGGNGYLANHLATHLSKEHLVFSPGKDQLNCLHADDVKHFLEVNPVDVVIHTALTGRENLFSQDQRFYDDAMLMWNNIRNQREQFKQLIHFGSAYDALDTPYGRAKANIAKSCAETDNFYNLRLFGVFHHGERNIRFFKKLYESYKFVITENKKFDYFHLEDVFPVVDFVITETPSERSFDVVYKEKQTLIAQAMKFCAINDVKTVIEVQKESTDMIGDSTILDSFNLPLQGLEEGFRKYKNENSTS